MKIMKKESNMNFDNVRENIESLKSLFPEVVNESGLNFETLQQLLGEKIEDDDEKFGLTWFGKNKARQFAMLQSIGTLRPCQKESVDWETTQNLFIEGENLEVLKLLQKSYANKVKMIYIDPPYNTGKEFIYPDHFQDNLDTYLKYTNQKTEEGVKTSSNTESTGRFHTKWLNMMYPRLILARKFLSHSGIIFISIDQVEIANLRLIMDELYGEENFLALLTRRAMHTVRNSSKDFNLHADYLLVYAKDKSWFGESPDRYIRQFSDKSANYPHDDEDGRGSYKLDPLHARNYYRPYEHTFRNGVVWKPPPGSYPRYAISTLSEMETQNRIAFLDEGPKAKRYLSEVQEGVPPNTILESKDVGFNSDGTRELRKVLKKDKVFPQPKPTRLIRYLIQLIKDPNAIVMDFFAGAGTTAEAVMLQNAEDGQNMRCISIQLPELTYEIKDGEKVPKTRNTSAFEEGYESIAEICKDRIKRGARLIKEKFPEYEGDLGIKVFKLDSSNIRPWNPTKENFEETLFDQIDHLVEGRSEEDILYELLLKRGVELTVPIENRILANKTVYCVSDGKLFACLDESIKKNEIEALGQGIIDWRAEFHSVLDSHVVFRDSAFADDIAKTNMLAILEQNGIAYVRSI